MFKIIAIVLILAGIFYFSRQTDFSDKISLPQFPSDLSEVDLSGIKDQALGAVSHYFPESSSQAAILGTAAKNDSLNLIIDAARNLKPEEYKTLQQFLCDPKPQ